METKPKQFAATFEVKGGFTTHKGCMYDSCNIMLWGSLSSARSEKLVRTGRKMERTKYKKVLEENSFGLRLEWGFSFEQRQSYKEVFFWIKA